MHPFAYADETEIRLIEIGCDFKSIAEIADAQGKLRIVADQFHFHGFRSTVLNHVVQCFLRYAVETEREIRIQPGWNILANAVRFNRVLVLDLSAKDLDCDA